MPRINLLWLEQAQAVADRLLRGYHKPDLALRRRVVIRSRGRCVYCGQVPAKYHQEHLVPRVRGGSNTDLRNLVMACPRCNWAKGFKTAAEFGFPLLGGYPLPTDTTYTQWCYENRRR